MVLTTEGSKELCRSNILEDVPLMSLWQYYTDTEVRHGKHIKGDTSAVFYVTIGGDILLKDFAHKTYTIFTWLMEKKSMTFYQVLQMINSDFKLGYPGKMGRPTMRIYGTDMEVQNKEIIEGVKVSIRIKRKPFTTSEYAYWEQYGIKATDLLLDRLIPLDHYWIIYPDDAIKIVSKPDNPIFCWAQWGDHKYKIYRPFAEKGKRWFSNLSPNQLFGMKDLPHMGNVLIITKSGKDRLVLKKLGYNAVGVVSESTLPDHEILRELNNRFDRVGVFFDNDIVGINSANRLQEQYGFTKINMPDPLIKDVSDFYKEYGEQKTEELCRNLISEI